MSVRPDRTERLEPCSQWLQEICEQAANDSVVNERLEQHLAGCHRCSEYRAQLRSTAKSLHELANVPVRPTPGFHSRWVSAVLEEHSTSPRLPLMAAIRNWGGLIRTQLRPAMALAPLWVLILFFHFNVPEQTLQKSTVAAQSPVKIFRAFLAQGGLWDSPIAARVAAPLFRPRRPTAPRRDATAPARSFAACFDCLRTHGFPRPEVAGAGSSSAYSCWHWNSTLLGI